MIIGYDDNGPRLYVIYMSRSCLGCSMDGTVECNSYCIVHDDVFYLVVIYYCIG